MTFSRKFRASRARLIAYGSLAALAAVSVGANVSSASEPVNAAVAAPSFVRLARGAHPLATPEHDVGPLDPNKRLSNLSVFFKLSDAQVRDREALKLALQDPASPMYHQWLTPEQYAARFGASADTITRTQAWLSSQGLQVTKTSRLGSRVSFSGRVADIQNAFHAEMRRYNVDGESHFAMSTAPAIPANLADVVLAIHNTHDFFHRPASRVSLAKASPDYVSGKDQGLAPPDWAALYDVNPLYTTGVSGTPIDGTGVSIAVVGIAAVAQSDLDAYRTKFNLPSNKIVYTVVPGTGDSATGDVGGARAEAVLDLEWSAGIAKNATIQYVATGADDGNVDDATYYAIEENLAPILSESWGGCEAGVPTSDRDILETLGSAASILGITYLAASGDSGAAGCGGTPAGLYVNLPAAYPEVTAVGGSEFPTGTITFGTDGFATGYSTSETTWYESDSQGVGAGGGGISNVYSRPAYQSGIPTCTIVGTLPTSVTPSSMRQIPDVSGPAAGANNGIYIACTPSGQDCGATGGSPVYLAIGGTSASTPATAGAIALVEQAVGGRLGNINPLLYALDTSVPTAFHDITTGNNEIACTYAADGGADPGCPATGGKYGYAATTGYDCATGLGSLDVTKLATAWATLAKTAVTITPTPTASTEGAPVSLEATVTVPTANSNILGGNVTFTFQTYQADGTNDLSWSLGDEAITGATVNGGNATLSIAIPVGLVNPNAQYVDVYASYGGDAHHLASVSPKARITFSAISLTLSPTCSHVQAGDKIQFTVAGGQTPDRFEINADSTSTVDSTTGQPTGGSTLDEQSGAFVAGSGQAGYVTIVALDKYDVEAIAYVEVGDINGAGTPPWPSDAGAPTGCVDPIVDAGTDAPVTTSDAGDAGGPVVTPGDGGTKVITTTTTSCNCTTAGHGGDAPAGTFAGIALGLGLLARRRRNRRA